MSIGFMKVTPTSFQHVGVRLMIYPDGKDMPEAIIWPDGREFIVDDCIGKFPVPSHDQKQQYMAYWVHVPGKAKLLYWNLTEGRWFVDPHQKEVLS